MKLGGSAGYDALAFRGNSGAAVAYPVSYKTGVPLIAVRKGESTHSSRQHAGVETTQRDISTYLIVDDLIDSGSTIEAIIEGVDRAAKYQRESWPDTPGEAPRPIGILLWSDEFPMPYEGDRRTYRGHSLPIFRA